MAPLWLAGCSASTSPEANATRARLAAMSDAERADLALRQERFARLEPAEQEQLRNLHAELSRQADSSELIQVMVRHQSWLNDLSPEDRAELADIDDPDKRIERMRELHARKRNELDRPDLATVYRWLLSRPANRAPDPPRPPEERFDELRRLLGPGRRDLWDFIQRLQDSDIDALIVRLSPEAQLAWNSARNDVERRITLGDWCRQTSALLRDRPYEMGALLFDVRQDELDRFRNQLSDDDRNRLSGIDPNRERSELVRMYVKDAIGFEPRFEFSPRGDRGPGWRPGEDRGGRRPPPPSERGRPAPPGERPLGAQRRPDAGPPESNAVPN